MSTNSFISLIFSELFNIYSQPECPNSWLSWKCSRFPPSLSHHRRQWEGTHSQPWTRLGRENIECNSILKGWSPHLLKPSIHHKLPYHRREGSVGAWSGVQEPSRWRQIPTRPAARVKVIKGHFHFQTPKIPVISGHGHFRSLRISDYQNIPLSYKIRLNQVRPANKIHP